MITVERQEQKRQVSEEFHSGMLQSITIAFNNGIINIIQYQEMLKLVESEFQVIEKKRNFI